MQVKSLYDLVGYKPGPREAWFDAWNLRQLYTFAFRRQRDCEQRQQQPRDRVQTKMHIIDFTRVHLLQL